MNALAQVNDEPGPFEHDESQRVTDYWSTIISAARSGLTPLVQALQTSADFLSQRCVDVLAA
jgi:hypothetical protein